MSRGRRERKWDCISERLSAAIDTREPRSLVSIVSPFSKNLDRGFHDYEGQTHVSAEPPAPQEDARVPGSDVDEERPPGVEAPSRKGAQAPHRHALAIVPAHALPATRRLRRRGEFQRVFNAGRRAHGRFMTIVSAPVEGAESRLGIVASRKLGGAVVRNRAKRLIREAFRMSASPTAPVDLVVILKPGAAALKAQELGRDYQSTLKRLGLSKS